MSLQAQPTRQWKFSRRERAWIVVGIGVVLAFGANLEQRTALRHSPMTDLGVFSCAAWTAWHKGDDLYTMTDWHGWHYQYPPTLAILFAPLAHPPPAALPASVPGVRRTEHNTPWGYPVEGRRFCGLHKTNVRFFLNVAVWYCLSVVFFCVSMHALCCALEGAALQTGPPPPGPPRSRWWSLRLLPLLICAGSVGTDLSRGQVDGLMLLAISLGLYLASRQREIPAGLCLAFPATVKLFPPLLLLYPIWRGRWRMALGVLGGLLLLLVLLPATALGPARSLHLYRDWIQVLAKPALGTGADKSRRGELTGMSSTDNQSLLAAVHNWRYHDLPRGRRPREAAPAERLPTYAFGLLALAAIALAAGFRRSDSACDLLIFCGLLIAVALVISPIVHNYYYLLLIPLITALLDRAWPLDPHKSPAWRILFPLLFFSATDIIVRLPGIGGLLRDLGLPLLSLLCLVATGIVLLFASVQSTPSGSVT